jgi:protoporphyrinogen IX oxidase
MPLLKLVHFAGLLCWCGTLLYLPALISGGTRRNEPLLYRDHAHMTRMVFNLIGTPAALIAIGSGTALFLRQGLVEGWLIVKLSTVAGMVICHTLCGVLVLHVERAPEKSVSIRCGFIGAIAATFITATLWLVLAKPF